MCCENCAHNCLLWVRRQWLPCVVCCLKTVRRIPLRFGRPVEVYRPQTICCLFPTGHSQSKAEQHRPYVLHEREQLSAWYHVVRHKLALARHPPNFTSIARAFSKQLSTHGTRYRLYSRPSVLVQSVCDSWRTTRLIVTMFGMYVLLTSWYTRSKFHSNPMHRFRVASDKRTAQKSGVTYEIILSSGALERLSG